MASRVQGFGRRRVEDEEVPLKVEESVNVHKPVYVDRAVLNEAVEETLMNADPIHADSMRRLWAHDQDSEAARAYFTDQVRQSLQSRFAELSKRSHVVHEVLTQEETTRVVEYVPEFNLTFRNSVGNEHAFFSARRAIDHELLLSKFPGGLTYLDFGGSVQYHVRKGSSNAVVISPFDLDTKDPTRAALTKLALRKIAADSSALEVSRAMALSVLADEGHYHRNETVQSTSARAVASIAVHVYDVPLSDWPYMMERCGVHVHEGCLHFVNDFFDSDSGEFPFSGGWFEIDRKQDLFRMRVGRSSATWYTHKWSDLMRYGANQILHTANARYSYQIVERRQDTIFYRILRLDSAAAPDRDQVYALPSVPMAEVSGFEVFSHDRPAGYGARNTMVRRNYLFPQALWERMLAFATNELDRGNLSYNGLFNHYRTLVPKQTINSVHYSGGQKVPTVEVPALVVMASVVAYADSLLMQRTVRVRTEQVQQQRSLADEGTMYKGFRVFVDSLVALGCISFSPFSGLSGRVGDAYLSLMRDKLVTWKPQVRYRSLNVALLVDHKELGYTAVMPERLDYSPYTQDHISKLADLSAVDPQVARDILDLCGSSMTGRVKAQLESCAGSTTAVDADSAVDMTPPDPDKVGKMEFFKGEKKIRRTVYPKKELSALVTQRRLAIAEAVHECEEEAKALRFTCARIYREVTVNGKPNERILRERSEELYNPDMWHVVNGVVQTSVLSGDKGVFSYSGAYVPVVSQGGEHLIPVREETYVGKAAATGDEVVRDHYTLPFSYTGYILVIDGLKVFNGPSVVQMLQRALDMPDQAFGFQVTCHQGPPGCGKTTTVAADADLGGDVFLTPTRVASKGLAERLCKTHSADSKFVRKVCRTLDSLLVNFESLPESAVTGFRRLMIDEYVLGRAGKWYAAAVLLGVAEVHAYGDSKQIVHKPRVQVPKFHLEVVPDVLEEEFLGYRNAPEILAGYNFVYNNEVRTKSDLVGSLIRVKKFSEVDWMEDCRLFSMYQADKKLLFETAGRSGLKRIVVNTVHEAQGSDCDQVVLYNGELRKRPPEDAFYLYGLLDYCLVALSRARKSFVYVKMSNEPDRITDMIEKAHDPRRVAAAKDVATQGQDNLHF